VAIVGVYPLVYLVCGAALLLMDEPFASVDAQTRVRLQDELSRILAKTSVTVLFITHDIAARKPDKYAPKCVWQCARAMSRTWRG
jgi:ABC-type proline/glycine betaine transport system ATPase subunit